MAEIRIVPEKNRLNYVRELELYGSTIKRYVEMYNKHLLTALEFGDMVCELYLMTDQKLKRLSKRVKR